MEIDELIFMEDEEEFFFNKIEVDIFVKNLFLDNLIF